LGLRSERRVTTRNSIALRILILEMASGLFNGLNSGSPSNLFDLNAIIFYILLYRK